MRVLTESFPGSGYTFSQTSAANIFAPLLKGRITVFASLPENTKPALHINFPRLLSYMCSFVLPVCDLEASVLPFGGGLGEERWRDPRRYLSSLPCTFVFSQRWTYTNVAIQWLGLKRMLLNRWHCRFPPSPIVQLAFYRNCNTNLSFTVIEESAK